MNQALDPEITDQLSLARQFADAGLSVIPIRADGSKAPLISWKRYQSNLATDKELDNWFGNENSNGIAAVTGKVSGKLEVLDFDESAAFEEWVDLLMQQGKQSLFDKLVVVSTPSQGSHVFYRCPDGVESNQKLAHRVGEDGKPVVRIETRGEGGYVLLPGSPESCHPLNKPYVLQQGSLTKIPNISAAERELLLQCARAQNKYVEPARLITAPSTANGNRPGDDFNRQVDWRGILEPHGWQVVGDNHGVTHWRRPSKKVGVSATTNHGGSDLLYVFSTNASPFEAGRAYTKFAAYALLNHSGDFSAAAADLAAQDYGDQKLSVHPVNGEVPPVKGRPWKLPHYVNRGKTTSSGGEMASARSCFSTVRTALGKLRITGLPAPFDVARSFPQRPLPLQPTVLTSKRRSRWDPEGTEPRPTSPFTG